MIDYILMSDIRTKLLLGTTMASVSLMMVMAVRLGTIQNNQPSAASTLGLMGHFEIIVENPDGTVSYAQGTNVVTASLKNAAGDRLFEANGAIFNCIMLGNGTNSATATTINAVFFGVNADIEEAALQNLVLSASDVLALQQFNLISLGASDDLTIDWTVTIDGS